MDVSDLVTGYVPVEDIGGCTVESTEVVPIEEPVLIGESVA